MSARFETFQWLPREGEAIWDYWLSLSPMAPVFGVPWRFGDVQVVPDPKAKAAKSPIRADAEEAVIVATAAAADAVEEAAELVEQAPHEPAAESFEPAPDTVGETAGPASETVPEAPIDDLSLIKGIGPKMVEKLHAAGITSFAQIASWDDAKVAEMGETLGGLPGAIARADWVGQAKDLV